MPHPALRPLFDVIDTIVELYLRTTIRPFLEFHDTFYAALNKFIRSQLDSHHVPKWFTANFITYLRTALVIPTLLVLSWNWWPVGSFLVLFVDFGDFLDGVVARYWVDVRKTEKAKREAMEEDAAQLVSEKREDDAGKKGGSGKAVDSDDDSFEVVSIGHPHLISSWHTNTRHKSYGGFVDAVCDKVYVVPCWIFLLSTIPSATIMRVTQYVVLWCLILAEAASGTVRFRAYFTSGGVSVPKVVGLDFSSSAVKADGIGKAKQTLEMVGSALFVVPYLRYLGLLLLTAAVPLAYESVRRKVKKRVVYVDGSQDGIHGEGLCHRTLKFWMQARGMGSKLIVGMAAGGGNKDDNEATKTDMVLNACACSAVDEVIAEAPIKVNMDFMNEYGIDYVVVPHGKATGVVEKDVIVERRCLAIGNDGTARPVEEKVMAKTE